MPTYSYRCADCGHAFDIHQAFTDDTLTVCPNCGGSLRKVFSPVGVTFSGSGFYRTDSRAKNGGAGGGGSTDAGGSASSSTASGAGSSSSSASPGSSGSGASSGSSGSSGSTTSSPSSSGGGSATKK